MGRCSRDRSRSELHMESGRIDRDRPTVGVIAGVGDQLIVERQRRPFVEADGVIGFHHFLRAIVELSVPDQDAHAAGGEVSACLGREAFDHAGQSDPVVGPSPGRAFQHRAE